MLLALDVGNTNIHLGVYSGRGDHARLIRDWRMRTEPRMTADELALTIRGLLGPDIDQVTSVVGLSTVPSLLREMRVMVGKYYGIGPHVLLEPGVRTGVPLLVDNPKEVGTDRVANALAAYTAYERACIIVDFGTTTLVDVVSAKGEFLGGAIAPGVQVSSDASQGRRAGGPATRRTDPAAFGRGQEHHRGAAVGHPLRIRRPGRRSGDAGAAGDSGIRSAGRCRGGRHGLSGAAGVRRMRDVAAPSADADAGRFAAGLRAAAGEPEQVADRSLTRPRPGSVIIATGASRIHVAESRP